MKEETKKYIEDLREKFESECKGPGDLKRRQELLNNSRQATTINKARLTHVSNINNKTMTKKVLTSEQLNELKTEIYGNAVAHGFHDEEPTVEHSLGLVLSEIGEAINADRNPDAPIVTEATLEDAKRLADIAVSRGAFLVFFITKIKGSVIEELAMALS